MRTLALLPLLLTVALGLPLEQKEAPAVPSEVLQRPLVADLVPVQGHVVEENPAPQPEPGRELQPPVPLGGKEQADLQVQEEVMKEPEVQQELTEDSNAIKAGSDALFAVVSLDPGLDKNTEALQVVEEPEAESKNNIVLKGEETEQMLEGEFPNNNGAEYGFERPIMNQELETEDEMQRDNLQEGEEEELELDQEEQKNIGAKYDFERPIMDLKPLAEDEMQMDELLEVSNTGGVYGEQVLYLESEPVDAQLVNEINLPDVLKNEEEEDAPSLDALGEPLRLMDEDLPLDDGFGRFGMESQSPGLRSVVPAGQGRRFCSGVVLEGKCFQFFSSPMKAAEAEFFCQKSFSRGHLASVTSPNVHREMMNLMRRHGGTRRTWVGGLLFLDTRRFVWLDGSHWGYADWLPGEPNHTANKEHCVELLASGKFNDFTCWEPQAFICSYPNQ